MSKIAVIGAGSWGTALALVLDDNGHDVKLWSFFPEQIPPIKEDKENKRFLPNVKLSDKLANNATSDLAEALNDAEAVVMAVPTSAMTNVAKLMLGLVPASAVIINVAKGFEPETNVRMSQILHRELGENQPVAILSGPSHAEEVGKRLPTTVVSVGDNEEITKFVQALFNNTEYFRVYANDDMIGVELAGALKNVIALSCGIADGLGFGDNTQAALLTRGLWEIARLGKVLGGNQETFFGLAGMGDLAVTCGSKHSRNRRAGQLIGSGKTLQEAVDSLGMVAEGVNATKSTYGLAQKHNIEMPITEAVYQVLFNDADASNTLIALMSRATKHETH